MCILRRRPSHDPAVHEAQKALPGNPKRTVAATKHPVDVTVVEIVRERPSADLEQVNRVFEPNRVYQLVPHRRISYRA